MFTVSKTVSDETLNCIITIESSGKPKEKAPTSTALGLGQFLDATWLNTVRKHRPDIFASKSQAAILRMRTDPSFAVEMLARFTEDNQRIVGMKCTGGDLYLAHFLGARAAERLYAAEPTSSVEPLVGQAAVRANESVLEGKTVAQVRTWAARRMFQSKGHAWVAKYYVPSADDEPPDTDEEPTVENIPDTQHSPPTKHDTPAATTKADDPDDVGPPPPIPETWQAWLWKLAKSKIQWASTAMSGLSLASLTGLFSDPRILFAAGVIVIALLAVIIIERGRKP